MNILTDMEMRTILNNTKLCRTKLNNGKIALAFYLNDNNSMVILREFAGEYQLRKFIYEAVVFRSAINPNKKDSKTLFKTIKALFKFLLEKRDINNEKIV